ncbi:MAG: nuclease A inhibitor family protein [Acidobacteria bacterium]|nr:nuclease A inhibitor family protein [Acidobacteriota bacterium]
MKQDAQLLEELEKAIAGLLFMSESDYPFSTFIWKGNVLITEEYLREQAGGATAAPVKAQSVEEFFHAAAAEPDWKSESELAMAKRYQALVRWLRENLSDFKVYRVGEIDIQVYLLGRSPEGNWIGVSTRVVET